MSKKRMVLLGVAVATAVFLAADGAREKISQRCEPTSSPLIDVPIAERSETFQASPIDVLFVIADDLANWQDIISAFSALPESGAIGQLDSRFATPTVSELAQYDVVFVAYNWPHADSDALGDNLADYIDNEGGKVINTFRFPPFHLGGRFLAEGYDPLLEDGLILGQANLGAGGDHAVMNTPYVVNTLWCGGRDDTILAAGAELVALWDDSEPLAAVKGSVVGVSAFLYDSFWDGHFPELLANACVRLVGGGPAPGPWSPAVYPMMGIEGALSTLRRYRDQILAADPQGAELVARLYRDHCAELSTILLTHPRLLRRCSSLIKEHLPGIKKTLHGGKVKMAPAQLAAVSDLLDRMAEIGSREFKGYIGSVQKVLKSEKRLGPLGIKVVSSEGDAPRPMGNAADALARVDVES